ncbi:MAG: hypothetical protein JWQ68_1276 [Cryobacterium sp.]|nr:hypothetical protein [Cryobacterium sp.]
MIGLGSGPDGVSCSRAACNLPATWRLEWRNPRIHKEGRVKTWLACDEHLEFLREFLAARDFPLTVSALPQNPASVAATAREQE